MAGFFRSFQDSEVQDLHGKCKALLLTADDPDLFAANFSGPLSNIAFAARMDFSEMWEALQVELDERGLNKGREPNPTQIRVVEA